MDKDRKVVLNNLFIKPSTTIKEAMHTINKAAEYKLPVGITLITNKHKKLIGTVTDGDIRKALVRGVGFDEPVKTIMAKNPIVVSEGLTPLEMIDSVMKKVKECGRIRDYKVDQVIVTDKKKRVVDVLDFYELWYKQEIKYKKICVAGVGYVGLTLLAVLAEGGYQVTGFDVNRDLIKRLNKGDVPFYEKSLQPIIKFHLKEGNIKFISALTSNDAEIYIICVGTPINEKTKKPDYSHITRAAKDIGKILKKEDLVILRSTVSVGTTRQHVLPILEEGSYLKAGDDFYLAFVPERVVEGRALEEIKQIPQIVAGVNKRSAQEATRVFQVVSPTIIILDRLEEAEIIKLMNNTFRDLSFSFSNKTALLCSKIGLDAVKMIKAANEGYFRNPIPLPSPGVGGYCLTKDPYIMAHVADQVKLDSNLFLESRKVNADMIRFVVNRICHFLKEKAKSNGKVKIYILGFAFKGYPETSDIRNSPTLDVLNALRRSLGSGVRFCGYDPFVRRNTIENLGVEYLKYKDGFKNSRCVLIMNNNPQFAELDIFTLLALTKKPALFFDGWSFFNSKEIGKIEGITYSGLGGGS